MNRRLVKLPGGRVLHYRPDPMVRYVGNAAAEPSARPPAPAPTPESRSHQVSAASGPPDHQVLDTRSIEGSEVVIIGAGAVGGYLAYSLAAAARITIDIIDFDVVEAKHVRGGRTIYTAGQVRQRKVYAAKQTLEDRFPGTVVHAYPYNVMDLIPATLCHLAKRAALVLCAIDDAVALLAVNRLLFGLLEVLYVALHARGSSGHLILTVPHVSACLQCALAIESAAQIETLHAEPALGLDIQTVASYAATVALEVIRARVTGRPVERWDITKNVFYFANRREQLSPDGPGVVLQRAQKRPGCPVCQPAPANLLVRS